MCYLQTGCPEPPVQMLRYEWMRNDAHFESWENGWQSLHQRIVNVIIIISLVVQHHITIFIHIIISIFIIILSSYYHHHLHHHSIIIIIILIIITLSSSSSSASSYHHHHHTSSFSMGATAWEGWGDDGTGTDMATDQCFLLFRQITIS